MFTQNYRPINNDPQKDFTNKLKSMFQEIFGNRYEITNVYGGRDSLGFHALRKKDKELYQFTYRTNPYKERFEIDKIVNDKVIPLYNPPWRDKTYPKGKYTAQVGFPNSQRMTTSLIQSVYEWLKDLKTKTTDVV